MSVAKRLKVDDPELCFDTGPEPHAPRLRISASKLEALNIPYFSCLAEAVGQERHVRVACSCLQGCGDPAWRVLFEIMRHPTDAFTLKLQPSQFYNLVMLVNFVFPLEHRLAQALLRAVRAVTHNVQTGAETLGVSGITNVEDIRTHTFLSRALKDLPPAGYYFRLPNNEAELQRFVRLGFDLQAGGHEDWWVCWSRALLCVPDLRLASQALVPGTLQDSLKVADRLRQWLGGFDLAACLRRHGAILAGGALVSALRSPATAVTLPDFDVDVWVPNHHTPTLTSMLEEVMEEFRDCVVVVRSSIVHMVCPRWQAALQFVMTNAAEPWLVPDQFDMDYVKAYYDGTRVFQHPECVLAWRDGVVRRVSSHSLNQKRLDKAREKGFRVELPADTPVHPDKADSVRFKYFRPRPGDPWEYVQAVWQGLWPGCQVLRTLDDVVKALAAGMPYFCSKERMPVVPGTDRDIERRLRNIEMIPEYEWHNYDKVCWEEWYPHKCQSIRLSRYFGLEITAAGVKYWNNVNARHRPANSDYDYLLVVPIDFQGKHQKMWHYICWLMNRKTRDCPFAWRFASYTRKDSPKKFTMSVTPRTRWDFVGGAIIDKSKRVQELPCATVRIGIRKITNFKGDVSASLEAERIRVYPNPFAARLFGCKSFGVYVSE